VFLRGLKIAKHNEKDPRRTTDRTWSSRLLRHLARKRSGSILRSSEWTVFYGLFTGVRSLLQRCQLYFSRFFLIFLQQTAFFGISESVWKFVTRRRSNPEQLRYGRFSICPLKLVEKTLHFRVRNRGRKSQSINQSIIVIYQITWIHKNKTKKTDRDRQMLHTITVPKT